VKRGRQLAAFSNDPTPPVISFITDRKSIILIPRWQIKISRKDDPGTRALSRPDFLLYNTFNAIKGLSGSIADRITLMLIRILLDPDPDPNPTFYFDADPDPTFQFDADPCGSGSTTLLAAELLFVDYGSNLA